MGHEQNGTFCGVSGAKLCDTGEFHSPFAAEPAGFCLQGAVQTSGAVQAKTASVTFQNLFKLLRIEESRKRW